MNAKSWRGLAATVALVIAVYLVGSWIAVPGILVGEVVASCEHQPVFWQIWWSCPDRTPRTTELAGAGIGLAAVAWVAWVGVRRIARAFGSGAEQPAENE